MSDLTLIETIKTEEGKIANLSYHQERCTKSRKALFNVEEALSLASVIKAPPLGVWRCRIHYAQHIKSIEYIPYVAKTIHVLKITPSTLNYTHKYAERSALSSLLENQPYADDIIIEKEGYLTDTTIANIAFYDGSQWWTPRKPLLEGTTRQRLLDNGFLKTKDISIQDLKHYTQVALMNAMIGFDILKNIHIQDTEGKTYDY